MQPGDSGGGERRYGYGDKTEGECSLGKLEEVQWSVVRQKDAHQAKWEDNIQNSGNANIVVWSATKSQEQRQDVNDMPTWMYGVKSQDKI